MELLTVCWRARETAELWDLEMAWQWEVLRELDWVWRLEKHWAHQKAPHWVLTLVQLLVQLLGQLKELQLAQQWA